MGLTIYVDRYRRARARKVVFDNVEIPRRAVVIPIFHFAVVRICGVETAGAIRSHVDLTYHRLWRSVDGGKTP